jgi:hypothetical protein
MSEKTYAIDEATKAKLKGYFKYPYDIQEVISYVNEIDIIYEFIYKNFTIIVYYRKNKDKIDFTFIKKVITERAYSIIKNKSIVIHLLLTSAKKMMDENCVMGPRHINSGFTFINKNEIFIFRKEEFAKVIIHELIHHDKNIHSDYIKPENKQRLLAHFNINPQTEFILNEAIVELWATVIHLSLISKEYKLSFKELLSAEINYSLFKSRQILKIQQKKVNKEWFDKCNIFNYIIIKTILFFHFSEFTKIYSLPYDDTKITNFILTHSQLPVVKTNPFFLFKRKKIQRPLSSLCFMLTSDL